jgi:hypothetical protein
VGETSLRSLAEALGIPPEVAFRIAGFLPPAPERTEQIEKLIYLFDKLNETDRRTILGMMQFLLSKKQ